MGSRLLLVLVFAWVLASQSARADVEVQPGDLLMADGPYDQIIHVLPQTGQSFPFSPRAGSGPNLLSGPNGIAIDPDGRVFVTNTNGDLISIDPVTGAQSVVHAFDILLGDFGPVDIGASPRAIDISDYTASPSDRRDLYVLSADGIRRIDRTATALASEIVVPSDSTIASAYAMSLVDDATGPTAAWVTTGTDAVHYDLVSATPTVQSIGSTITGLDFRGTASAGDLYYSRSFGVSNASNGVFSLLGPLSTGGQLFLPQVLAATPPNLPPVIYSAQDSAPIFLVPVSFSGGDWVQSFLVLDSPKNVTAMAVSPAALPEPGFGAETLSACFALAALRARRARPRPATRRPVPAWARAALPS